MAAARTPKVAVADKDLHRIGLDPKEVRKVFCELVGQLRAKNISGRRINKRMVAVVHRMGIFLINMKKWMLCKVQQLNTGFNKRICSRSATAHHNHSSRHHRQRLRVSFA